MEGEYTYSEALEYCEMNGGTLAKISDARGMECASYYMGDMERAWIGINSPPRFYGGSWYTRPYWFGFVDFTHCPDIGMCLPSEFWEQEGPLGCASGSPCVALSSVTGKINNDLKCNERIGFCCEYDSTCSC